MERIDFILTETETELPKEIIQAAIILHDDYIEYLTDYYLDEKDESLGWVKDKYIYFNELASKDTVKGMSISYNHKYNKWKVTVHLLGFNEDIWVHFDDEIKAQSLFKKIMNWKYKK